MNLHLDDLTNDGLNVLIAKLMGLNEDIEITWSLVGSLILEHQITLSPNDSLWDASFEHGEDYYIQSHPSPIHAVAKVFLEFRINTYKKMDSSIGIRVPKNKYRDLISGEYLKNDLNSTLLNLDEQLSKMNKDIKILEAESLGDFTSTVQSDDTVELYIYC